MATGILICGMCLVAIVLYFRITKLDIFQSYFFGEVEFRGDKYKFNLQAQRRGKVLRLPFGITPKKTKVVVRLSGSEEIFVEDYIPYKGESEWVEIDSDEITFFVADHQDQFDTIEIMDDVERNLNHDHTRQA